MPAFGGRAGLSKRPAVVGAFVGTIAEMPKIPMISMVDGGHIGPPSAARAAFAREGEGEWHMETSRGGGSPGDPKECRQHA